MAVRVLTTFAAALALVSTPVLAASSASNASASRLSLSNARIGAPTSPGASRLGEGTGGLVAAALVAGIAAILVIGLIAESDDDDEPASP